MAELLEYAVRGIPTGCVFALLAVGLVLTYKTSGVFNLAFAAQAYASAAVFYTVRKDHEWPLFWSFLLAVVIVGPAIGLLLERLLFRYLRGAGVDGEAGHVARPADRDPRDGQAVLRDRRQAEPAAALVRDGAPTSGCGPRAAASSSTPARSSRSCRRWSWSSACSCCSATRSSDCACGPSSRAPAWRSCNGVDSNRVSMVSWVLSSLLAGLAGVLLAPLFASLNPIDLFTAAGRGPGGDGVRRAHQHPADLRSAASCSGVLQAVLAGKLPTDSVLSTGLRPALPFVVLFALLLLRPGLRTTRELTDPLATVDPPPPAPVALSPAPMDERSVPGRSAASASWSAFWSAGSCSTATGWAWSSAGVILGIIMLSLTWCSASAGCSRSARRRSPPSARSRPPRLVNNFDMSVLVAVFIGAGGGRRGRLRARPPGRAPRRRVPRARHPGVRPHVRERARSPRLGERRRRSRCACPGR